VTNAAAQAIIGQEAAEREKNTERLRALRLAKTVAPKGQTAPDGNEAVS